MSLLVAAIESSRSNIEHDRGRVVSDLDIRSIVLPGLPGIGEDPLGRMAGYAVVASNAFPMVRVKPGLRWIGVDDRMLVHVAAMSVSRWK